MRFPSCTAFVLLTVVAGASAGEAAKPCVTLTIGDGARLVERWNASAYKRWWDHAAMTKPRAAFAEAMTAAEAELGVSPLTVLTESHGIDVRFIGMAGAERPVAMAQAVLGPHAAPLFARMRQAIEENLEGDTQLVDEAPPAGADESFTLLDPTIGNRAVFARFQETVVVSLNAEGAVLALPAPAEDSDLSFALDADALRAALAPVIAASDDANQMSTMIAMYSDIEAQAWIVPEGVRLLTRQSGYTDLTTPIDRALLTYLPATTTAMAAIAGLRGEAVWKLVEEQLLPLMASAQGSASGTPADPAAMLTQVDEALAGLGIATTVEEIVRGFDGSSVMALSNAAPFPGLTLALPRSPALDRLVEGLIRMAKAQAPAEGASTALALGIPVPLTVGRGFKHWVASNDATMVASWLKPQTGGWEVSPAGKAALAAAPESTTALSGVDLGLIVRMATPWIGMGLAQLGERMPAEDRQAITGFLADFGNEAGVERSVTWVEGDQHVSEYRGLMGGGLGGIAAIAIVAGIAVPNLLESRVTANESAAAMSLKSGLFPAQVQFQGGGYADEDGDHIGSYGFLREMSGAQPVAGGMEVQLLMGPVAKGEGNGYRYAVFIPDAEGGGMGEPAGERPVVVGGADQRERYWIGYAWPIDAKQGRMMFAIDQSGQVYSTMATGEAPLWNALYGDEGAWGDEPTWQLHRR